MKSLVLSSNHSKQEVSSSLHELFADYDEKRKSILSISNFVKKESDVTQYFITGNKITQAYASTLFDEEGALKALNAEFWSKAMKMTDVLTCMTAQKRNEWHDMIHDLKTPEFEKESVISTLHGLLLNRNNFLADKVDGIFQKLSHTHVTNSPMGFKQRMILDYMINSYGSLTDKVEYLNDLRGIIAKIMKRDEPKNSLSSSLYDIVRNEQFGEWFSFDGGAFKIRIYKKGTAHLEIHENMSHELNIILAQKYPSVIGDSNKSKRTTSKKTIEVSLQMDLLKFETCNILAQIAESVTKDRPINLSYYDIENPQVLKEVKEVLEYLQAQDNGRYLSFNYDASSVLKEIVRLGAVPEQKSHQFYPTEEFLAKRVATLLHADEFDSTLEPSAGLGGIAQHLYRKRTTCVEISSVHCEALKKMGFKDVVNQDFLKYTSKEKFDRIAMNPPFTKGQAEAHLKHAITLLADDGRLVAVLPASLKGKEFSKKFNHEYSEVLTGQFSDAQVSVVLLTLSVD